GIDAGRDVGRLAVNGGEHRAGLGVEAVLAAGVAHLLDRLADDAGKVDVAAGGDLAGDHGEAGRHQRFTGNAPHGVLRENGVENRIGDLIGDLVGVPFGHRLRSEQITTFTAHVSNRAPSRAGRSAGKTLKLYHIRHRWTRKNTERRGCTRKDTELLPRVKFVV